MAEATHSDDEPVGFASADRRQLELDASPVHRPSPQDHWDPPQTIEHGTCKVERRLDGGQRRPHTEETVWPSRITEVLEIRGQDDDEVLTPRRAAAQDRKAGGGENHYPSRRQLPSSQHRRRPSPLLSDNDPVAIGVRPGLSSPLASRREPADDDDVPFSVPRLSRPCPDFSEPLPMHRQSPRNRLDLTADDDDDDDEDDDHAEVRPGANSVGGGETAAQLGVGGPQRTTALGGIQSSAADAASSNAGRIPPGNVVDCEVSVLPSPIEVECLPVASELVVPLVDHEDVPSMLEDEEEKEDDDLEEGETKEDPAEAAAAEAAERAAGSRRQKRPRSDPPRDDEEDEPWWKVARRQLDRKRNLERRREREQRERERRRERDRARDRDTDHHGHHGRSGRDRADRRRGGAGSSPGSARRRGTCGTSRSPPPLPHHRDKRERSNHERDRERRPVPPPRYDDYGSDRGQREHGTFPSRPRDPRADEKKGRHRSTGGNGLPDGYTLPRDKGARPADVREPPISGGGFEEPPPHRRRRYSPYRASGTRLQPQGGGLGSLGDPWDRPGSGDRDQSPSLRRHSPPMMPPGSSPQPSFGRSAVEGSIQPPATDAHEPSLFPQLRRVPAPSDDERRPIPKRQSRQPGTLGSSSRIRPAKLSPLHPQDTDLPTLTNRGRSITLVATPACPSERSRKVNSGPAPTAAPVPPFSGPNSGRHESNKGNLPAGVEEVTDEDRLPPLGVRRISPQRDAAEYLLCAKSSNSPTLLSPARGKY